MLLALGSCILSLNNTSLNLQSNLFYNIIGCVMLLVEAFIWESIHKYSFKKQIMSMPLIGICFPQCYSSRFFFLIASYIWCFRIKFNCVLLACSYCDSLWQVFVGTLIWCCILSSKMQIWTCNPNVNFELKIVSNVIVAISLVVLCTCVVEMVLLLMIVLFSGVVAESNSITMRPIVFILLFGTNVLFVFRIVNHNYSQYYAQHKEEEETYYLEYVSGYKQTLKPIDCSKVWGVLLMGVFSLISI